MHKNGFIVITLGLAWTSLAGSPGYLPITGPVPLHFNVTRPERRVLVLPGGVISPIPTPAPNPGAFVAEIPMATPTNTASDLNLAPVVPSMPVATNTFGTLIGPLVETNGYVNPQVFLRFFSPASGGVTHETVVVPPVGFNPAQPPAPSSKATYTKSEP